MDRRVWLAECQEAVIATYDAAAPAYDEHESPSDMQREWVARAAGLIPAGGTVLDALCGTGKYFPVVAVAGHRIVGVDQSAGMLAQARARRGKGCCGGRAPWGQDAVGARGCCGRAGPPRASVRSER
jgi:ubiquinone/menaquinone biosynthesis C-methylase UbiE